MEIAASRIGKLAILAAISSDEEEVRIKERIKERLDGDPNLKLTITYISGRKTEVEKIFVRSIVSAAIKCHTIPEKPGPVHAVIHAGLEAWHGLTSAVVGSVSLKMKVAITSDGHWLAVAVYGDSAMSTLTNHERMGFGVMHL